MSNAKKLEELQRQRAQLDARIRDARNAARRDERKARNHALMVAGGLVVSHAPDGDWTRIDWDKLAAWLDRCDYKVAECEAEKLPSDEAYERLREWERKGRDVSSGAAKDGAEGDEAVSPSVDGKHVAAEPAHVDAFEEDAVSDTFSRT